MFQALGVGEDEERVEEKMNEEQVEKAVVMDVIWKMIQRPTTPQQIGPLSPLLRSTLLTLPI